MKIFFLLTLLAISSPALAVVGGEGGGSEGVGGGDEDGLAFQQLVTNAVANLRGSNIALPNGAGAENIIAQLQITKVIFAEAPLTATLGGLSQDSIAVNNRATNIVQVNRPRWKIIADIHLREAIALHEILSLLGVESTGAYPVSSQYAALFGFSPKNFGVEWLQMLQGPEGVTSLQSNTCSLIANFTVIATGEPRQLQSDSVSLGVSWSANGISYGLQTYLAPQDPTQYQTVLLQKRSSSTISPELGGVIVNGIGRGFIQAPDGTFFENDVNDSILRQNLAPGQELDTTLRDGNLTNETAKASFVYAANGSQVSLVEQSGFAPEEGARLRALGATSNCTAKPLSYGWVKAWGDPIFAARVNLFSASILQTTRAEIAYHDCVGIAGEKFCVVAKENLVRASALTDDVWKILVPAPKAPENNFTSRRFIRGKKSMPSRDIQSAIEENERNLRSMAEQQATNHLSSRLRDEVRDLRREVALHSYTRHFRNH